MNTAECGCSGCVCVCVCVCVCMCVFSFLVCMKVFMLLFIKLGCIRCRCGTKEYILNFALSPLCFT